MCRRLVDAGAFVSPVLTTDAHRFVTPLTFSALASEPARTTLWDSPEPSPHTHLGQRADLVVVAPATARVLAAYALGLSDDLLVATLLATRAPVVVCPAMHTEMWEQPAVQHNVALLRERGVTVVGPASGHLAGGDVGPGRLAEPADIVAACEQVLSVGNDLAGLRVLVTAGGTREAIDPVRYVGNRSSGKQGYAVAENAASRGADVVLVSTVKLPASGTIEVVPVESAADMELAVSRLAVDADVVVMAAAVADFRPKVRAEGKIKKSGGPPEIVLEPTPHNQAALGEAKRPGQTLVGFAAQTEDLIAEAEGKLR
ncbi:MAG: bifunctional phosphopantothenoylcysteine decarboxylase/phosphopantothenate--cysteine ligase CoaBC, partial [Acidimicrobiia bacterium]